MFIRVNGISPVLRFGVADHAIGDTGVEHRLPALHRRDCSKSNFSTGGVEVGAMESRASQLLSVLH